MTRPRLPGGTNPARWPGTARLPPSTKTGCPRSRADGVPWGCSGEPTGSRPPAGRGANPSSPGRGAGDGREARSRASPARSAPGSPGNHAFALRAPCMGGHRRPGVRQEWPGSAPASAGPSVAGAAPPTPLPGPVTADTPLQGRAPFPPELSPKHVNPGGLHQASFVKDAAAFITISSARLSRPPSACSRGSFLSSGVILRLPTPLGVPFAAAFPP